MQRARDLWKLNSCVHNAVGSTLVSGVSYCWSVLLLIAAGPVMVHCLSVPRAFPKTFCVLNLCAGEFAPKLLPCFHAVCAACARDLAKYKGPGRRCPMCREDVGYEELMDNFVVLDMLEQHQLTSGRERACSNECIGDDANATHYCEQCSKSLCQLCVSMHSRQRATVGHTLVTMQELQNRS